MSTDVADLWNFKCDTQLVMGCNEADRNSMVTEDDTPVAAPIRVPPAPVPVPVQQPVPVPVPVAQPKPVPVALPKPEPVPVAQPKPEPVPVALPKPVPAPVALPKPEPVPVAQPMPEPVPVPDSVPVKSPTTGGVTVPHMMPQPPVTNGVAPTVSQCRRYPGCALLQLEGLCCPTIDGVYLDCCTNNAPSPSTVIKQDSNGTHWWWTINTTYPNTTTSSATTNIQKESFASDTSMSPRRSLSLFLLLTAVPALLISSL